MIKISNHAKDRLVRRLSSVVTPREVYAAVSKVSKQAGEIHCLVKTLPSIITIQDSAERVNLNGDQVWAVLRFNGADQDPTIVTLMLRRSIQPQRGDVVIR